MQFRERITDTFRYLYTKEVGDEDIDNLNSLNRTAEEDFADEMGWYPMLYTYAKENNMSTPQVQNENILEFLMFINFFKKKQELDQTRLNKIKKQ